MNPCLYAVLQPGEQIDYLGLAVGAVAYLLFGLLPFVGALYLAYFLLTLPLRRNERARLFLDLLELGLGAGRSPEHTIADIAASRDRGLGARFHLLAAYIEQGLRLDDALDQVPRLLPPQVCAMLRTGQRIGNLRKVLPACRLSLHGSISQVRGALNYVLLLAFLATPFTVIVPIMLRIKVLPAFKAVFTESLGSGQLPAFTRFVLAGNSWFILIQTIVLALVWWVARPDLAPRATIRRLDFEPPALAA
jgi:type II secretory pathway component PulF